MPVDEITGNLVVIHTEHHEVHEGEMFHGGWSASVANNASADTLITVGAKGTHIVFGVAAGGACQVYLYEAPTASGGSAQTMYNMNRNSALVTPAAIASAPTVSATGSVTLVNGWYLPGGNSEQTRGGGGVRAETEWMLKPGTVYLLRVTNVSGASVTVSSAIECYPG